jgi:putative DNA primase/helicase
MASSSGRNEAGLWLACQLRDAGRSEAEADAAMLRYRRGVGSHNRKGEPEAYTIEEVRASIRSAYSRPARDPWDDNGHPVSAVPASAARSLRSFPFTDTGNAERFAQSCGERFR